MGIEAILALVIAGIVLLMAEVFVPGGVIGSIGALLLLTGIVAGFVHDATLGVGLLLGSLVFGLFGFWLWVKFFPVSPAGRRLILQEDAAEWDGFDIHHSELVGRKGTSHTPLRPAGTAIIDGKRVDVVTRGEMIAAHTPIRVIEVEGNRIVVTEAEPAQETSGVTDA